MVKALRDGCLSYNFVISFSIDSAIRATATNRQVKVAEKNNYNLYTAYNSGETKKNLSGCHGGLQMQKLYPV